MGSTHTSLHYHIVFSTKGRKPWIEKSWRDKLHEYLGGTVRGLKGIPLAIGGVDDHVHLLIGLTSSHCLADFMRELKKSSSIWTRDEFDMKDFAWQEGYGAFTVSPTARDGVQSYIANQEEHHKSLLFTDELIKLLDQAGIEYDPKWLN